MDQIALSTPTSDVQLPRIKVTEGYFHLSGLESHCQRVIAAGEDSREGLILALFQEIAASMHRKESQISLRLFRLREKLRKTLQKEGLLV